ncbi:MAG TPA: alpha/beta hydrolase [Candidatus Binatia bacterium]
MKQHTLHVGVALLLVCCSTIAGCGTPVGVKRMDPTTVQRELQRSILTSDTLSAPTRNTLYRYDLVELWEDDPAATIAALHEVLARGEARRNDVYALAELSFAYADRKNDPAYHRAAAVYAWLFLFPREDEPLQPLDARIRVAADMYNRGLVRGFAYGRRGNFVPQSGSYPVPFGTLDVYFDESELIWGSRKLTDFVPVADLEVKGLATRYRWTGIGAPLAASTEPLYGKSFDDHVEPWVKVPVTAVLRLGDDVGPQLEAGRVAGWLTLEEPVQQRDVEIDGQRVPLESETTASLAYMLAESPVWQREIGGFLQRVGAIEKGTQLASLSPYRPGRIPIILVHGTASSPGRWAQLMNEILNDSRIGPRVQAWLFMYDTGNPIGYSAMLLRESLREMVETLDPEGKDPALRDMVVIGHSQGGLLAKLTAIDSGDRFWRIASNRPFDEIDLGNDEREMIRNMAFIEPVPSVKRVVFLATPHRGSYVAGSWLAHQAARLIVLPADLTRLGTDLLRRNQDKLNARAWGLGTSVFGMTPGNPMIEELSKTPLAPGIKGHSIIAVKDPEAPFETADDGVVEYTSAHIDGVESEFIVVSGHSCQDNPHTINEIRRILLEHIAEYDAAHPNAATAPPPG